MKIINRVEIFEFCHILYTLTYNMHPNVDPKIRRKNRNAMNKIRSQRFNKSCTLQNKSFSSSFIRRYWQKQSILNAIYVKEKEKVLTSNTLLNNSVSVKRGNKRSGVETAVYTCTLPFSLDLCGKFHIFRPFPYWPDGQLNIALYTCWYNLHLNYKVFTNLFKIAITIFSTICQFL